MNILEFISKLIFPPRCALCNEVLPITFHRECDYDFDKKYFYDCTCEKCNELISDVPLVTILPDNNACISSFPYEDLGKKSVFRLKYRGYRNSAVQLGRLASKCVMQMYDREGFDIITYVPMTKKKQRKRTYNQAQLLANICSELLNIKTEGLLIKLRDNPEQHSLSRQHRRKNAEKLYEADTDKIIKDKRILLVDDVVTTGYTLVDCIRALKEAGAKSVLCVTAAKTIIR